MGGLYRSWMGCISPCCCWGECPILCDDPRTLYKADGTHKLFDTLDIPNKQEMK